MRRLLTGSLRPAGIGGGQRRPSGDGAVFGVVADLLAVKVALDLDLAVPPRSSSERRQPVPASPLATSGPLRPDAPSSRPLAALPTRAAPASRWLARGRRRR